jgi:glutaminyl-peptide cyclotransferase
VAAVLAVGLVAAAVGGAFHGGDTAVRTASSAGLHVNRFDGRRAFAELRRQVDIGPRPAGSAASRRLAARLRRALPHGRYEAVPGGLRNVVGRLPGRRPAVVVAAHYDTKAIPGFVGANDGAGGTAAVVELARALRRAKRPWGAPELRFVLFDGEEATNDEADFYRSGLRGSKAYARRHRGEVRAVVLLDFVADKALRIPREAGSDPHLWARLRRAARRVGAGGAFPAATVGEVLDDHTPFARRGIPAVDLIDFDFPCWHKACDDLSAVSAHSLDLSGEAVLELLRTWR